MASTVLSSKLSINGYLPPFKSLSYSLQVKGQESASSVSLSVTFSNLLTTSKTLNTPKNTGTTHTYKTNPKHIRSIVVI